MNESHIESLYQEAKSALKARDYEYAIELLKRVLVVDENYKDTPRLLEKAIRLRKLRWYKNPRLWGMLGLAVVFLTGIIFVPGIVGYFAKPTSIPSVNPTLRITSTTAPPTATATPLPYKWALLNSGEFLPRDIITAIVVVPNDPDIIYVGTQNAGIYKSIDGGLSWQPANNGLNRVMISSLAIDPENPNNIYAGTRSGRLFATRDAGISWKDITPESAQPDDRRKFILIDPQNPSHLYYSDSVNIFISSNQGSTWQESKKPCSFGNSNYFTLQKEATNNTALYISTDDQLNCKIGVYRSSDIGENWEYLGPDDPDFWGFWLLSVGKRSNGGHVIFGMQGHNELFASFDYGNSWTKINQQCNTFYTNQSDRFLCGGFEGLSISRDDGNSWQKVPSMDKQVTAIWASDDVSKILLGTSEGLVITNDGGKTWTDRSSGLGVRRLELETSPDGSQLFVRDRTQGALGTGLSCCNQNDLFQSTDGQNWEVISSEGYGFATDADGKTLYRAEGNNLLVSVDNGKTWNKRAFPFWAGRSELSLFAHPEQSGLLYAIDDNERTLYMSEDRGLSWEEHNPQNQHLALTQLYFGQQNIVYMIPFGQAFRSADRGKTWNDCGYEFGDIFPTKRRFAIDPRDDTRVFIASIEKGLLFSSNACQTWEARNNGLGNLFINSITIDPANPDTMYLGTDGGVYISFDAGQSWGQANDGLFGTSVVYSIVVDKDGNVFAATPYGIFRLEGK